MDYTASLFLLRDFAIRKQAICVLDDLILFGNLAFRKTARTNYLVDWFDYGYGFYHQRERRYYTLDSVVFLLHNTHLGHAEYGRKEAQAGICTLMKDSDWQILLAYLHGSVPTTSSIDYAFVAGPGDLPVPLAPRADLIAAAPWIPPVVPRPVPIPVFTPVPVFVPVLRPVPVFRPPNPNPVPRPILPTASRAHDPCMWLLVSALDALKGQGDPALIREHIRNCYPVDKILKKLPWPKPLEDLVSDLISQALNAKIVQRNSKQPMQWELCPGVSPSYFSAPPEFALQLPTPSGSMERQPAQPDSQKHTEKSVQRNNSTAKYPDDWVSGCVKALPGLTGGATMVLRSLVEDALRLTKNGDFVILNKVFEFTVSEAKRRSLNHVWDLAMVRTTLEVGIKLGFVEGPGNGFRLRDDIRHRYAGSKVPTVLPTVTSADFVPSVASALRALDNPAGSTAAEIQRNIQNFFFSDAVRRAAGMKLKDFIATTAKLAVTMGVVTKSEVSTEEKRYKLCPAWVASCFRESAAVAALRRTEKELPKTADDDCVIVDEEEVQSGNLGCEHGELWAWVDRALKALDKTGACNGEVIFGTVSMLKESESDKVSPWKYEDIEAVLLWGERMGVYVKEEEGYRMAGKAGETRVRETNDNVVHAMEMDNESHVAGVSEEVRSTASDHGDLCLPGDVAGCSSVAQLQEAALPNVPEVDNIARDTGCGFTDASTVRAQMAAYQSFATLTYKQRSCFQ